MFSRLKDFVEERSVARSSSGVSQCIGYYLVNLQSRFPTKLPKQLEINTTGSRFYSVLIRPQIRTFLSPLSLFLSLEENSTDIMSDTSSKIQFPGKSRIKFWVGIGGVLLHLSCNALTTHLPFATSCLYRTGFRAVEAMETKYPYVMDVGNFLRAAITKHKPRQSKLHWIRQPHPPH